MAKLSSQINREFYNNIYYKQIRRYPVVRIGRGLGELISPVFFRLINLQPGERLLDVACGNGWLLRQGEHAGGDCWGIDISIEALICAREQCHAKLICCDASAGFVGMPTSYFDVISCHGSLEHISEQGEVIGEMGRVCKPDGRILIQVPNKDYILHKLGYETDWQAISGRFGLDGWIELFESNGLVVQRFVAGNKHLGQLRESSSYLKYLAKLLIHPFVRFTPIKFSFEFFFLCHVLER